MAPGLFLERQSQVVPDLLYTTPLWDDNGSSFHENCVLPSSGVTQAVIVFFLLLFLHRLGDVRNPIVT